jgi:hypothetical protein
MCPMSKASVEGGRRSAPRRRQRFEPPEIGRKLPPSLKSPGGLCPAPARLTVPGVVLSPEGRATGASARGWQTVPLTCCQELSSTKQSVLPNRPTELHASSVARRTNRTGGVWRMGMAIPPEGGRGTRRASQRGYAASARLGAAGHPAGGVLGAPWGGTRCRRPAHCDYRLGERPCRGRSGGPFPKHWPKVLCGPDAPGGRGQGHGVLEARLPGGLAHVDQDAVAERFGAAVTVDQVYRGIHLNQRSVPTDQVYRGIHLRPGRSARGTGSAIRRRIRVRPLTTWASRCSRTPPRRSRPGRSSTS